MDRVVAATQAEKDEVARRIKAARAYAGIGSAQALAIRIDDAGFGRDAIAKWETGSYTKPLGHNKLKVIANACGLSVNFFYWDFRALHELDEDEMRTSTAGAGIAASRTKEQSPDLRLSREPDRLILKHLGDAAHCLVLLLLQGHARVLDADQHRRLFHPALPAPSTGGLLAVTRRRRGRRRAGHLVIRFRRQRPHMLMLATGPQCLRDLLVVHVHRREHLPQRQRLPHPCSPVVRGPEPDHVPGGTEREHERVHIGRLADPAIPQIARKRPQKHVQPPPEGDGLRESEAPRPVASSMSPTLGAGLVRVMERAAGCTLGSVNY